MRSNKLAHRMLSSKLLAMVIALLCSNASFAAQSVAIQGRLLNSDGSPVTSSSVQFTVKVKSPGAEDCLLYQETQTLNLSQTAGAFALTLGSGTRAASTVDGGNPLNTVFSNSSAISLSSAPSACANLATSFTPGSSDTRNLEITFNDGSGVDSIPTIPLAWTPQSIYSQDAGKLAGINATQYLKVATGATPTTLSVGDYSNFVALLNGTSTQYMSSSATAGTVVPNLSSAPTTPASGQMWFDSVTNTIKYYNGTATQTIGTSSGLSSVGLSMPTIFSVTGSPLTANGSITATLATQTANTVFAGPSSGGAAAPTFRALTSTDLPIAAAGGILKDGGNSLGAAMTLGTNDAYSLGLKTNNSTRMTIDSSGNVGVGTTNPGSKLEVNGDLTLGNTSNLYVKDNGGNLKSVASMDAFNSMYIGAGVVGNLRIGQNSSTIAIGGIPGNPASMLSVYGNGSFGTGYATTSAPTNGLIVQGNVGIGTTAPNEQLELTKNLRLPATTATTGIIKSGSNTLIHTFGTTNFFAGVGAGNLTLTGTNNTIVGPGAGAALTSGNGNYLFGDSAGANLTTGQNNVMIGREAGKGITTGSGNILIGGFSNNSGTFPSGVNSSIYLLPSVEGNVSDAVNNAMIVGGYFTSDITDLYLGGRTNQSAYRSSSFTINAGGGQGTNDTGRSLIISGGRSTGNAAPGGILFKTSDTGASGSTLQTLSEKMRISGTGYVGIGTTSPGATLDVRRTGAGSRIQFGDSTAQWNLGVGAETIPFLYIGGSTTTSQWFWRANWNDTTVPANTFKSPSNTSAQNIFSILGTGSQTGDYLQISTSAAASGDILRINSSGNVGIGTTGPSYKLDVAGDINASGSVRAAGVALTSDARFKKEIQTLDLSLEKILSIRGVQYFWRQNEFPEKHFNDRLQIGVVAQEVEKVYPEVVETNADGFKSVNYPALVAPLIEAVRTLYMKLSEHDDQLALQERQLASKEAAMIELKQKLLLQEHRVRSLENYICSKDPNAPICNSAQNEMISK